MCCRGGTFFSLLESGKPLKISNNLNRSTKLKLITIRVKRELCPFSVLRNRVLIARRMLYEMMKRYRSVYEAAVEGAGADPLKGFL